MLTKSATLQIDTDGTQREVKVTPLFLQNHQQPWQPNEIYEITKGEIDTESLGKIIVDDHRGWHYEGEHGLSEEEIEQIARFVFSQI